MEQKQLSVEELNSIKDLSNQLLEITSKFGQVKVEKINLLTQMTALDELEKDLDNQYLTVKEKEYTLSKELSEKYGDGVINLETGIVS